MVDFGTVLDPFGAAKEQAKLAKIEEGHNLARERLTFDALKYNEAKTAAEIKATRTGVENIQKDKKFVQETRKNDRLEAEAVRENSLRLFRQGDPDSMAAGRKGINDNLKLLSQFFPNIGNLDNLPDIEVQNLVKGSDDLVKAGLMEEGDERTALINKGFKSLAGAGEIGMEEAGEHIESMRTAGVKEAELIRANFKELDQMNTDFINLTATGGLGTEAAAIFGVGELTPESYNLIVETKAARARALGSESLAAKYESLIKPINSKDRKITYVPGQGLVEGDITKPKKGLLDKFN